ncbi:MAG: hypothetical protein ABSD20_16365 [Terriglobales bacterium]|jgi:hypothetical protein
MTRTAHPRFLVCIDNDGNPASLEVGTVYRALPTEKIAREMSQLRVVDESGEDYLYPASHFANVRLPQAAKVALLRAR